MWRIISISVGLSLVSMLVGCDRSQRADPAPAPAPESAPAPAIAAGDEGHEGHDEANVAEEQARATHLASVATVGQPPSDEVPLVEPSELLADPERFTGGPVRFRGRVKGFCVHARAWYAVDVPGGAPPYVRVLAMPAFRVPEGVMGAEVVTEGTVEIQRVPAGRIQHFEEHHRLGSTGAAADTGEVTRVVVRASGATFTPVTADE